MFNRDALSFINKLSLRKVFNMLLVVLSFYRSRLTGKPVLWGKPISLSVEPTTSCNLRCPECPSGLRSFTRPTGMLDMALFEAIINQQATTLSYLLLYFQGEPYLHPDFTKMVALAHRKGIYTATSTNAHFLTDEMAQATVASGLDRLIISIDGTTQETYEQYRVGGTLQKVIEGTKKLVYWKAKLNSPTPHLIFQFLVVKPNEHQLDEVKQLATKLGVDEVKFKTAQLYDFENGHPLMPSNSKFSRYKEVAPGKFAVKHSLDNHCWKMWHSAVVTWDGNVVPCCFDKDAAHKLGNLQDLTFEDIWTGTPYNTFRTALLKGRSKIDICQNCTEGAKVWA